MKTMHKLTIKNLLMNKTRTLVTLIGIILSAALITTVACMFVSAQETLVNYAIQRNGNYTAGFFGNFSQENIDEMEQNRNIQSLYKTINVGVAKIDDPKYDTIPYVIVKGVSTNAFTDCFNCTLSEGRFPQNSDEVVLSKNFIKATNKTYHVGDKLHLTLGLRTMTAPDETGVERVYSLSHDTEYDIPDYQFNPKLEQTYTIVGILDNLSQTIDTPPYGVCYTYIYTCYDLDHSKLVPMEDQDGVYYNSTLCALFTPQAEQNYLKAIADIVGTEDTGAIDRYLNYTGGYDQLSETLQKKNIAGFGLNETILQAKFIKISLEEGFTIAVALVVIFGIVILSSIFIIRNSFYISINEKSKLYGMLASTGATPRQIRNNVFFEGFVLGVIAIPLGILFGICVSFGLVSLCNAVLGGLLGGVVIQFAVSWLAVAMALILCIGTIFMSVLSPAIETARIAPIVAIRGNQDIKISKRKRKKAQSYKTPKLISKLFGIGGSIAWKNLQRSKKKYRATVISITASVAVYLAASSVISCLVTYIDSRHQDMTYNIIVSNDTSYLDTKDDVKKSLEKYQRISELDEITESMYYTSSGSYMSSVDASKIDEQFYYEYYSEEEEAENGLFHPFIAIIVVDKGTFAKFADVTGHTADELSGKGIFLNSVSISEPTYDSDGNIAGYQQVQKPVLKDIEGYSVRFRNYNAVNYEEESEYQDPNFDIEKYGKEFSIPVGAVLTSEHQNFLKHYSQLYLTSPSLFVTADWLSENIDHLYNWFADTYYLTSSDPDKTQDSLEDMGVMHTSIINIAKEVAIVNSLSFIVQFFVYSFIGMIALIGLTNVFNTINTNMNLRKKEFAALRSIGMTNSEFDRMITLESFFYTFKALLIGVPLGLLLGYGAYQWFISASSGATFYYIFPLIPLLLSIGIVALLVWIIMVVSIRKVRNQNIIETIRNDNI